MLITLINWLINCPFVHRIYLYFMYSEDRMFNQISLSVNISFCIYNHFFYKSQNLNPHCNIQDYSSHVFSLKSRYKAFKVASRWHKKAILLDRMENKCFQESNLNLKYLLNTEQTLSRV